MSKLIIKRVRDGSFKGYDGEEVKYYWYKALRGGDQITIEFGSAEKYDEGDEIEIELEKIEVAGGKYRYKEPMRA